MCSAPPRTECAEGSAGKALHARFVRSKQTSFQWGRAGWGSIFCGPGNGGRVQKISELKNIFIAISVCCFMCSLWLLVASFSGSATVPLLQCHLYQEACGPRTDDKLSKPTWCCFNSMAWVQTRDHEMLNQPPSSFTQHETFHIW